MYKADNVFPAPDTPVSASRNFACCLSTGENILILLLLYLQRTLLSNTVQRVKYPLARQTAAVSFIVFLIL